MYKLLIFAVVAGLVSESHQQSVLDLEVETSEISALVESLSDDVTFPIGGVEPCYHPFHIKCWTQWFDLDDPCGRGDYETLEDLRKAFPGKICPKPVGIEAQTVAGLSSSLTFDVINTSDTTTGFICRNADQPSRKCQDYRVRFSCHPPFCGGGICWTQWYDRDNPSGLGDWELLQNLREENPGEICEKPLFIEAATTNRRMDPAESTGEKFHIFNPTQGFVCRRQDQKNRRCSDYKVRFGCPCNCKDDHDDHGGHGGG